jgi:hypothetical protein
MPALLRDVEKLLTAEIAEKTFEKPAQTALL